MKQLLLSFILLSVIVSGCKQRKQVPRYIDYKGDTNIAADADNFSISDSALYADSVRIIFNAKRTHIENFTIDDSTLRVRMEDSIRRAFPHIGDRYFLISYTLCLKNDIRPITGQLWLSTILGKFPNYNDVQTRIFKSLLYERSCYQQVIILSIFEFKEQRDFEEFGRGIGGDKDIIHKKACQSDSVTDFAPYGGGNLVPGGAPSKEEWDSVEKHADRDTCWRHSPKLFDTVWNAPGNYRDALERREKKRAKQ